VVHRISHLRVMESHAVQDFANIDSANFSITHKIHPEIFWTLLRFYHCPLNGAEG